MLHKELESLIKKGEIKEGDRVWICDYRLRYSQLEKPIRHIVPMEVIIANNNTLPADKTVYYGTYHFRGINKNGTPSSKIIAPHDSTGGSLNIFLYENECRKHYRKQCQFIKDKIDEAKESYISKLNDMLSLVNKEIVDHC